jgi:hypothetical protein
MCGWTLYRGVAGMSLDRDRAGNVGAKRRLSLREQHISQRGALESAPLHDEAVDGDLRLEKEDR